MIIVIKFKIYEFGDHESDIMSIFFFLNKIGL